MNSDTEVKQTGAGWADLNADAKLRTGHLHSDRTRVIAMLKSQGELAGWIGQLLPHLEDRPRLHRQYLEPLAQIAAIAQGWHASIPDESDPLTPADEFPVADRRVDECRRLEEVVKQIASIAHQTTVNSRRTPSPTAQGELRHSLRRLHGCTQQWVGAVEAAITEDVMAAYRESNQESIATE